jgi:hypothetical protein
LPAPPSNPRSAEKSRDKDKKYDKYVAKQPWNQSQNQQKSQKAYQVDVDNDEPAFDHQPDFAPAAPPPDFSYPDPDFATYDNDNYVGYDYAPATYEDNDFDDYEESMEPSAFLAQAVVQQEEEASFTCTNCCVSYASNNLLHEHLRRRVCLQPVTSCLVSTMSSHVEPGAIIESPVLPPGNGHGFRTWHFVTALAYVLLPHQAHHICLDTGCTMSLVDRQWLKTNAPDCTIQRLDKPQPVRGIGSDTYQAAEYAIINLHFPGKSRGTTATAKIQCEVHIVDGLSVGLLVGVDILAPHKFALDIGHKKARIGACNVDIQLTVSPKKHHRVSVLYAEKATTIPAKSYVAIPVATKHDLPLDRDFIFEPDIPRLGSWVQVMDGTSMKIVAANFSDSAVKLPRRTRLGRIEDLDITDGRQIDGNAASLCLSQLEPQQQIALPLVNPSATEKEVILPNGITVYGES